MAYDGHSEPESDSGLYVSSAASTPQRSARRRKQAIVGVAGAAAVLAGAGFLATQLMNESQPSLPEPEALAPMTTMPVTEPTPVVPAPSYTLGPRTTRHAAPVRISPVPPPPPASVEAVPYPEEIGDPAVEQMQQFGMGAREEIRERTEVLGSGSIRVVSARRDLTGERLALLSRDEGRAAGRGVRCTDQIRFGTGLPSGGPGVLVCWRTSEGRSVITIGQGASAAESVEVINREWFDLE